MKILFVLLQLAEERHAGGMYGDHVEQYGDHNHDVTIIVSANNATHLYSGVERGVKVVRVRAHQTLGIKNKIKKDFALISFLIVTRLHISNSWKMKVSTGCDADASYYLNALYRVCKSKRVSDSI